MGIKESGICSICEESEDSFNHMLYYCLISRQLWSTIEEWISEQGFPTVILTGETIILGYDEKPLGINSMHLITKKVIYNAKKLQVN